MASSQELGAWGEEKAARYLEQQGYRILERNFHSRFGEIDLVAEDDEFLVFVEVRLRKNTRYGLPEETVDHRKQHKLRLTAEFYLQRHPTKKQPRFDVVALYAEDGMDTWPLPVRQIKNAF
jgi:putative endonuclease